MVGRSVPRGSDVRKRWKGRLPVHRRDASIEAKRVGLGGEPAVGKHRLERPVLAQQICRPLLSNTARSGYPIRGVAPKGDEVGNLDGIDAVSLPDLRRTDAGRRSPSYGLENGRPRAHELERVAIRRRD